MSFEWFTGVLDHVVYAEGMCGAYGFVCDAYLRFLLAILHSLARLLLKCV